MNEIEVSAGLDNPNIIKIYEIYEFNNAVYIVSEYICPYLVFAKVDNFSIVLIKLVPLVKLMPEFFSDKWLKPSTIFIKTKLPIVISSLRTSYFWENNHQTWNSLILVWLYDGTRALKTNWRRKDKRNL